MSGEGRYRATIGPYCRIMFLDEGRHPNGDTSPIDASARASARKLSSSKFKIYCAYLPLRHPTPATPGNWQPTKQVPPPPYKQSCHRPVHFITRERAHRTVDHAQHHHSHSTCTPFHIAASERPPFGVESTRAGGGGRLHLSLAPRLRSTAGRI